MSIFTDKSCCWEQGREIFNLSMEYRRSFTSSSKFSFSFLRDVKKDFIERLSILPVIK